MWMLEKKPEARSEHQQGTKAGHGGSSGWLEGTLLPPLPKAQPKPWASSNRIKQPALALSF